MADSERRDRDEFLEAYYSSRPLLPYRRQLPTEEVFSDGSAYYTSPVLLGIRESGFEYEIVGIEERVIENSSLSATSSRKFTVTQEWSRTWQYEESIRKAGGLSAKLGGGSLGEIGATISREIAQKYSISEARRQQESEEVSVQLLPGGRVKLTLTWKMRWQLGFLQIGRGVSNIEIAFRVAKGLRLDQSVEDL